MPGFSMKLTTLALSAALAGGALSVPGVAEESAALEEIVVTAQRRETALQDTPIAVTVFTGEKIADMGIFDIRDLSSIAPNTALRKQPASNSNAGVFIRGVGAGETSLMVDPKVGVYIDGVYMSKTVGGVFDVVDLESVEVLRGPQGTLFGRNSSGGALNLTTAKPSGEFGLKLQASVGNDGYRRYAGTADLPTVGGVFSAKISGTLMDYDGWAVNSHPGQESKLASENNGAYRIAVRVQPVDSFTVDYAYDRTNNKNVPTPFQISEVKSSLFDGFNDVPFPFAVLGGPLFAGMAATIGDPNKRREQFNLDSISTEQLDVEGHTVTAAWDFSGFTLKYIFSDRETNQTYARTDLDGGAYTSPDLFYARGGEVPTPGFHASIPVNYVEMTTHEVQLFGDLLDGRVNFTLGYYNYEEEVYQENPQTFTLPIAFLVQAQPILGGIYTLRGFCNNVPDVGPVCVGSQRLPLPFRFPGADPNLNGFVDFIYGQNSKSWALYGQATFEVTDSLQFTGGLRYTDDRKTGFLFNENLFHRSIDDRLTGAGEWDNLSYFLNLNYAVNADVNVYVTHSTGYNSGGFNARALSVTGFTEPVREEEISAVELGLKADWWDSRLRTNVALFHNKFNDVQIGQFEAGSGGASLRLINAGQASYTGIELDMVALLFPGLIADVTYGYTHGEFDEYLALDPLTDQQMDIAAVTTMPGMPEYTANIGLQYDFNPFPWGRLSLRFDATYSDDIVFHPFLNRYDSAADHWLLNARISLNDIALGDGGRLRVSAWVRNLADEQYREWGIDFATLGFAGNTYGRPRTYGIDLVYSFDD